MTKEKLINQINTITGDECLNLQSSNSEIISELECLAQDTMITICWGELPWLTK